mmetsp:Transcript_98/g.257  ORF Transcript_98/g.257 Transcript_98/m.257 type:complete len:338 (+) Transcript_98:57-1070(+)|eukprot:CAMPEP_0119121466 /NCGR_PEP_ID=MMETSP1310-20130426/2086_1 /TAXON_ID=464262 /ORGANISM="Genus nov. species nov., Strain RCC2339" /LENGTH=337 /DNA_ID=CAMNT_0007111033 /DNA_START=34 /DNA_END=1047 /DNA_ORIENTATION=+
MEFAPPVIDLDDEESVTVSAIRRACELHGFFVVKNHAVGLELVENARAAARRFFALPVEEKMKLRLDPKATFLQGYAPLGAEASDVANLSLTGNDKKNVIPKDLMESFQVADPGLVTGRYPGHDDGAMRDALERIFAATRDQGLAILCLVGKAIGAPDGFFKDAHQGSPGKQKSRTVMRVTRYPSLSTFGLAHDDADPVLRIGPHRDLGSITLLFQSTLGGLQVQLEDGTWVNVPPVRDSIVVNLGNLMRRYCNKIFKSSIHRVISNEHSDANDRYSVILFMNPDDRATVAPIPQCVSETNPPQYEDINAGAYMDCKITQLFDENAKEFKGKCRYDD